MEKVTVSEIAIPIVKETKSRFTTFRAISFDKGFHSPDNKKALKELFAVVVLPKKGNQSASDKARETAPEFKRLRKKHSAVESCIHALEVHGLDICSDQGRDGFKRYVSLSILAYNLHRLGALLLKQDMRQYRRKQLQQNRAAKRSIETAILITSMGKVRAI